MKIWKIGIVGCGNIAETVYIPQMEKIKNARIVAVCDSNRERAAQIAEKFGIDQYYDDIDEFLAESEVEICMSVSSIIGRHEYEDSGGGQTSVFTEAICAGCEGGNGTDRTGQETPCGPFNGPGPSEPP